MKNRRLFSIFRHVAEGVKRATQRRSCLPRAPGPVTACLCLLILVVPAARADEVADFYRGHRVDLVVGFGPGGGNDVYARLLARHIGKYLPVPGAGSLRAANYIYSLAPKDGSTFGLFARDMALVALIGGDPAGAGQHDAGAAAIRARHTAAGARRGADGARACAR